MALDLQYDTKEAIPAGAAEHYTETDIGDGKKAWVLQGKGFAPAAKLDEFRNSNRDLLKFKTEAETKFKDVDPDEYKKLKGRAELFEEGKLIAADKLEEKINSRLESVKKEHTTTVEAMTGRLTAAERKVAEYTIDGAALKAALDIGIAKGAQPDIIARVRGVFSMNEKGELIAIKADGKEWYESGDMLTPAGYVKLLATEAPHLFAQNAGGGAGGSGNGGGAGTGDVNPWDPKINNLTEQSAIYKKDKPLAQRMAAKFGKTLP